eukprot:756579-Hanusia_phi.AAC.3
MQQTGRVRSGSCETTTRHEFFSRRMIVSRNLWFIRDPSKSIATGLKPSSLGCTGEHVSPRAKRSLSSSVQSNSQFMKSSSQSKKSLLYVLASMRFQDSDMNRIVLLCKQCPLTREYNIQLPSALVDDKEDILKKSYELIEKAVGINSETFRPGSLSTAFKHPDGIQNIRLQTVLAPVKSFRDSLAILASEGRNVDETLQSEASAKALSVHSNVEVWESTSTFG